MACRNAQLTSSVVCLSFFLFVTVEGYAKYLRTGVQFDSWASPSRRSWCVGAEGRCYTTGQCCEGYVCAAFGDVYGQNPEIPGYCVKQKELSTCTSDNDCGGRFVCSQLPHSFENYCVPGNTHPMATNVMENEEDLISSSRHRFSKPKATNGLGRPCVDDSDCAHHSRDGDRLCCQEIRRYRQKPKKACEVIRPISNCIPVNSASKHPGK